MIRYLLGVLAALIATAALADPFSIFSPGPSGPVKSNGTYALQSEVAADIIGLWSGTCDVSHFLAGNGTCLTAITSLTSGAGITLTPSTITGTGSIAITVPVVATNGGTGQTTFTLGDLIYSNAANSLAKLGGNTTTAKQFLTQTGNGSVSAAPAWGAIQSSDLPGTFSGFANSSATIGLTAVNGAATTAARSDSAPALSQAIAPTWTAAHTFSFAGVAIDINSSTPRMRYRVSGATANQGVTLVVPSSTGIEIDSATDAAPTSAVTTLWKGSRSGAAWSSLSLGNSTDNPTYSFLGTGTLTQPDLTGTFTGTISSGCTTTPTGSVSYTVIGNVVTVTIPAITCTSNGANLRMTGMPSIITPATSGCGTGTNCGFFAGLTEDNGVNGLTSCLQINSGPSWDFGLATVNGTHIQCVPGTGFTSSGTKGFAQAVRFIYQYN